MPDEHDDTTAFRGAQFTGVDFTGATFRDCDLRRVKIVDSWLVEATDEEREAVRGCLERLGLLAAVAA
jgi:uncharacterized protein YjbI with pentapeptide repeats